MELGKKLLACRLQAGLSQRQLAEGIVTRNMLSRIEHGASKPSLETLRQLAERLHTPVAQLLEEASVSPLDEARALYQGGSYREAIPLLEGCQSPEGLLLLCLCRLALAGKAIEEGRYPYARELLEQPIETEYVPQALERQRLLLLSRLPGAPVRELAEALPGLDEELLLLSQAQQDPRKALGLLEGVREKSDRYLLLRGNCLLAAGEYAQALEVLRPLEQQALPLLERCARELGDYALAYRYAVLAREKHPEKG